MEEHVLAGKLQHRFAQQLPELAISWQAAKIQQPALLILNEPLAKDLGLDPQWLRSAAGASVLVGNALPVDAHPVAQLYAGHQFGGYSAQLGDGRGVLLGEVTAGDGTLRDLHLKGAGRTPIARGDGFAVVGPMLREYLVSEAMHALGVPTTRSLAVTATGRRVQRDDLLPAAVLARVAASHLRVGSFQYARATGDLALLSRLVDHAIDRHYPALRDHPLPALGLLETVVDAQASLTASWIHVGFVHGVMNTDNVTISGETIDYGPCAFLDAYDPAAVFSSIDHQGRYAYGQQPAITLWNLERFAESLLPLLGESSEVAVDIAHQALAQYSGAYSRHWTAGMRAKLGLEDDTDDETVQRLGMGLLELMAARRIDFTEFFRALSTATGGERSRVPGLGDALPGDEFAGWCDEWIAHRPNPARMNRVNPAYVPRNHLLDAALDAANDGEMQPFLEMLEVVTQPFAERPGYEKYLQPPPVGSPPFRSYCGT